MCPSDGSEKTKTGFGRHTCESRVEMEMRGRKFRGISCCSSVVCFKISELLSRCQYLVTKPKILSDIYCDCSHSKLFEKGDQVEGKEIFRCFKSVLRWAANPSRPYHFRNTNQASSFPYRPPFVLGDLPEWSLMSNQNLYHFYRTGVKP